MMQSDHDLRLVGHQLARNVPIRELLQIPGVNVSFLLHEAARNDLIDKMKELVETYGAEVNGMSQRISFGNPLDVVIQPPIIAATEIGSLPAVKWLLDHGADVNIRKQSDSHSTTALWTAAEHGNVRIAKVLLDAGADVNTAKTSTGNTALFIAVQNGHKAMVALLLTHGADPDKCRDTEPIIMAVGTARPALVAQLIHAGAKIPMSVGPTLNFMRSTQNTVTSGYIKKVSEDELKVLQELLYDSDNASATLRNNPNYVKARKAERKGDYHAALRLLREAAGSGSGPSSNSKAMNCAQWKYDVERILEAIYGVPGSDGRMSVWNQVPIMSLTHPESLQFNAWTRARNGRKIYIHGGVDYTDDDVISSLRGVPKTDELWQLDIDTREWSMLRTTGKTPGARSGHSMFFYNDALYVWGGKSQFSGVSDAKLYRLPLDIDSNGKVDGKIFTWEIMKCKNSLKPPPREDFASVLYRGKYYITGGNLITQEATNDLWCLNMSTLKWTALKSDPTVERSSHGMWAGNGKLYVFGGQMREKHVEDPLLATHTVEDFASYDIEAKTWRREVVVGDRPFDISEFTVLPLYHDKSSDKNGCEDDDEPSSVIIWGGYTELNRSLGPMIEASMKQRYGKDLYKEFVGCPYRNRMLRFDMKTEVWTLLQQTRALLPKAQSFAAEIGSDENGQTRLLVGGGYGFTPNSSQERCAGLAEDILAKFPSAPPTDSMMTPRPSTSLFEVSIADERDLCFAENNWMGKGWAWKFFDCPGDKLPQIHVDIGACSPTLHNAIDLTYEDFLEPSCDSVRPNDSSNLMGVRVKLHGLKGRKDLNGQVGRCGAWEADKERYRIILSPHEPGGPANLLVKTSNLFIARPLDVMESDVVEDLISNCGAKGQLATFPRVRFFGSVLNKAKMKKCRPLDYILSNAPDHSPSSKHVTTMLDIYYGPVSAKAQVVLRTIAEQDTAFKQELLWMLMPKKMLKESQNPAARDDAMARLELFEDFYSNLKERDTLRVGQFEAKVSSNRSLKSSSMDRLGSWMKVVVALDGITPPLRRELIVSPGITMQALHNQVLCPTIGWTSNFHCYAFRRIHGGTDTESLERKRHQGNAKIAKAFRDSVKMMKEECWIGPKTTTATDSVFQPLYIGGAMANDKLISLGDLFLLDEKDEMFLQYVHDFGDWWSHNIRVTKYDGHVPPDACSSVAHLISGDGLCPPEDTGGIEKYAKMMSQLTGRFGLDAEEGVKGDGTSQLVDPSSERWWDLMNGEVRGKHNGSTSLLKSLTEFDLDAARAKLRTAIRQPRQKVGRENVNYFIQSDFSTGLTSELTNDHCKNATAGKHKDPLKFCAVCDVTVALKVCSGCNSIAFCSREHQLQYWPNHKKDCRRIQKDGKKNA